MGSQLKIGDEEYKLYDIDDTHKNEISDGLKNIGDNDLEDMVFRNEITYYEVEKILDLKYIDRSTIGHTLPPGIYEISDINLMLKSILPKDV